MITKTARTALGLAALLLLGIGAILPAAYADGTISACGAGGVIPSTASGTWTVTKNLTATGTCIKINANGVAIDLHGHKITGPGNGTGAGITDSGGTCPASCQQNIIIANGTIKGFGYGILLDGTEYATISNMNVTENTQGGISVESHAVITDSRANNNLDGGMFLGNGYDTVRNSQANNNGGIGMLFSGGFYNTVTDSQANNNGRFGMNFTGGNDTISNSQANNNKGQNDGIFIDGSGNSVTGTTANGNGSAGIVLSCPSDLFDNTASGNPGGNIMLSGTGCARLDNNPAP
jgi:hypothetical protein